MNNKEINGLDFADWPLSDAFLAEIGRVAIMWSTLETHLDICLGKVAGFDDLSDPRAFVLVKHMSLPQKLDALAAICRMLTSDHAHLADYKSVVSGVKAAQAGRNRFLHNAIGVNPETGDVEIARGSARGELKVNVETIQLVDIKRVTADIHKAMLGLHGLVTAQKIEPKWTRAAT